MRPGATRAAATALVASLALGSCVRKSAEEKEAKEQLKAYILDAVPAKVSHELATDFSGKVKLVGADLRPTGSVKPGQKLELTLYWKSEQKLDSGYRLFTHVLDAAGERILNIDNVGPLRDGKDGEQRLPPSSWDPGKVYADKQSFTVPAQLKSSRISIVTGIWRDNERLAVSSGPRDSANRALVATLSVSGASRNSARSHKVPSVRIDQLPPELKITIDGKLDEPAWAKSPPIGPFVDVRIGEANSFFPVDGSAKMLWNAEALFVAFEVKDKDVVGGFPKDAVDPHLWTRDTVEIMVDPDGDGDNRDYYEIQINPQNLVFDSFFDRYNEPKQEPNGPFGHQEWSAKLTSAVRVDGTLDKSDDKDTGYTVEAKIPWSSFDKARRVPPALGDEWRINLYAMQNNGGVAWSPILNQGNFHKASRFGRVLFGAPGWNPPPPASASASAAPSTPSSAAQAPSPSPSAARESSPRVPGRDVLEGTKHLRTKVVIPAPRPAASP